MALEETILQHIKTNSIATIGSDGLVGSMVVNIYPGKGPAGQLQPGDTLGSTKKVSTVDMMSTLSVTNQNAAELSKQLLKITRTINEGKGTLGSKIQKGITEIQLMEERKTVMYHIEMPIHSISGFTGHSDRRELENYIHKISPKPERVIVFHGEESKANKFASWIYKTTKRESMAPPNGTTIRLR